MRLVFLTYNICDGGAGRTAELFKIVRAQDADVILLQEVMDDSPVAVLAAEQGAQCYVAESNSPRRVALISRLPIQAASSFHPVILRHGALAATLEYAPGQTLTVFGIHLSAPAFTLPVEFYRLLELRAILRDIKTRAAERMMIAGDLNSIAPGDRVALDGLPRRLRLEVLLQGGLLARQVIGRLGAAEFLDCYRALHPREDGFTLPPAPAQVRLDYFFVNRNLCANVRACEVVTAPPEVKRASDHLPVRLELEME